MSKKCMEYTINYIVIERKIMLNTVTVTKARKKNRIMK